MGKGKRVYLSALKILIGIFTAISIISISTIVVLNFKFLYKFIINKYDLVNITGVSKESLINDYNGLINYLQSDNFQFHNPHNEYHKEVG